LIHKGNEEQIPFAYELYAADESRYDENNEEEVNVTSQKEDGGSETGDEKHGGGKGKSTKATRTDMGAASSNFQVDEAIKQSNKVNAKRFKETFSRQVQVHFVGVWDTVSSVGVVRHKVLPGTADGMLHVCLFRHALALDERRVKFLPEYVNQGLSEERTPHVPSQAASLQDATFGGSSQSRALHTKEVWFVGTHSDI